MSAYLVVDVTVHDPEMFKGYMSQVPPIVKKHGGTYLARGGVVEVQEGDWHPQRLVVVEFPDKQHAQAFLADPEYQPVVAIRHAAATTNMVLIDG